MTAIVMTAPAKMPSSVKARYRRVAVVKLDPAWAAEHPGETPKRICERARGVKEIVKTWERLLVWQTEGCAYQRALAEAYDLAHEINSAALVEEMLGELS